MESMLSKDCILIVDDEPLNSELLALHLSGDYDVLMVNSGIEALDVINTTHVDLVLLDIAMPEIDGLEVARILSRSYKTKQIPIIFLTSDTSEATIEAAFELGASDYISKPFRYKEIIARVKNRLESEKLKQKLRMMFKSQERLLDIVDNYVLFVRTDLSGIITEISRSYCKLLDAEPSWFIGKSMSIFRSDTTPNKVYQKLWNTIKAGQVFSVELENKSPKGVIRWFRVTIYPEFSSDNQHSGFIAFYNNIDNEIRYQSSSYTDHLTGLFNRLKFEEEFVNELYRAKRYEQPLSLILIDIDFFKKVNDSYGHDVGDILLTEFASLIKKNVRHSDLVARWGGEEFIVLCPNTTLEAARTLAEILRILVEKERFSKVGARTASFGVAEYEKGMDKETLFHLTDKALYKAKNAGRNRVASSQNPSLNSSSESV